MADPALDRQQRKKGSAELLILAITAVRTGGGIRTYIPGPGAGPVYLEWDGDGLFCVVSTRDLKPSQPWTNGGPDHSASILRAAAAPSQ
jgi:hypothetical protein